VDIFIATSGISDVARTVSLSLALSLTRSCMKQDKVEPLKILFFG
jgi:hypothetical protein